MKKIPVTITLRSELPGEPPITQHLEGTLTLTEDTVILSYQEPAELGGGSTCLTFRDGRADMERAGALSAKMSFAVGETLPARYETPYGTPVLSVCAHSVGHTLKETGGMAMLRYTLLSGNAPIGNYTLKFNVKEKTT